MTGIGGDELFGGYYTHQINYVVSNFKNKTFKIFLMTGIIFTRPLIRSRILSDLEFYKKQLKKITIFSRKR